VDANKIVADMRRRLVKHRGHFRALCEEPDIDYSWLSKFANGKITNPTIGKLEALDAALEKVDGLDKQAQTG